MHLHINKSNRINQQNNNQITSIQEFLNEFIQDRIVHLVGSPLEKFSGSAPVLFFGLDKATAVSPYCGIPSLDVIGPWCFCWSNNFSRGLDVLSWGSDAHYVFIVKCLKWFCVTITMRLLCLVVGTRVLMVCPN